MDIEEILFEILMILLRAIIGFFIIAIGKGAEVELLIYLGLVLLGSCLGSCFTLLSMNGGDEI